MRQQAANREFGAETFLWPWPAFPAGALVFLVGSYLYVWLRVEPLLEYHSYGPYFFRQRVFMETFLGRPGGLASYAGVFLAQLNCLNWLGALVFVLSECLVLLAALGCLARISGRAPGFVALVPLFLLLALRNRYGCPVPAISLGLLLALAARAAHVWLPWRRPWWFTAASGLTSGLLFFLAGIWSALLFAVLCGLFVFIQMRNWPAGLGCLVLALAAPLAAIAAGNLEMTSLVDPWPEGVDWVLAAALYASVPVAGVAQTSSLLYRGFPIRRRDRAATACRLEVGDTAGWKPALPSLGSPVPPLACEISGLPANAQPVSRKGAVAVPPSGGWFRSAGRGQAVAVLAFLLGWAAVGLTFDRRQKLLAEIDYDTSCGQYEAVLAAARQVKALNHSATVRLHLALYHTGRLAEELFSFHNMIDDAPMEGIGEDWRAQSQPLFELGLVNDAEHMAHDALEMEGDRPDLLRLLARINFLKDRPQAAQVFLNVLSLIPFQGERANEAWPAMDPQMPTGEGAFLARVHTGMLTNEVPHEGLPLAHLLNVLLASNPTNQMAFEYLMADYMMGLDLKKAVERLRLLDNFPYVGIPRPYEEALLLYQQLAGVRVQLKGRTIRPETAVRFRQFREAAGQLEGRPDGPAALAASFGDTYWYFYYAARSREQAAEGQASAP
ncbi:MAG TPA: DUF6057 family protein [Dongiaceae bacterium]|nr:DUF6057 family protein [Dongiaceae bacterium]